MINTTIAKAEAAGQQLFEAGKVEQHDAVTWYVIGSKRYIVNLSAGQLFCSCPYGFNNPGKPHKHTYAVEYFLSAQQELLAH